MQKAAFDGDRQVTKWIPYGSEARTVRAVETGERGGRQPPRSHPSAPPGLSA